jgi:AraC family transcriptional regulator
MEARAISSSGFAMAEPLCRPRTVSYFHIENAIQANGIFADIRHFGWSHRIEGRFEAVSHYLDYSLGPRPTNARLFQGGRSITPPGEIVYLPRGTEFSSYSDPGDHSSLCLTFDNDRSRRLFESEEVSEGLSPCFDVRAPRIRQALARLAEEVRHPGFGQDILVESIAIGLVVDLCRHLSEQGKLQGSMNGRIADWRLRRLREQIDAGLAGPLSITDLAADCGMSPRHLIRTFKTTTGVTLSAFIADARIERAKQELLGEDIMIKVIAGNCGFQSAAAFSAAFRKATGLTPRQYREERFRLAH